MSCSVCGQSAQYVYEPGGDVQVSYCTRHLPKFLNAQKRAGLLKSAPKPKAKKVAKEETTPEEE